jgi:hypothetical protein
MTTNNQLSCRLVTPSLRKDRRAAANIGLPQAGLTMELHTVLLSTYICAWRQVVAFNSRLRQAVKR